MHEEINNCKSLIIEQTTVIRLLQNEVDSLKSDIMQVKGLAQGGSNSSSFIDDIRVNRRLSGLQINSTKTNESNYSASLFKDNVLLDRLPESSIRPNNYRSS